MSDRDLSILEEAARAVMMIDRRYRRADLLEKRELKPQRDKAFNAYARARLKLLEEGIVSTAADLREMRAIREEIGRARAAQTVLAGAVKLAQLLAKFA